MPKRTTYKKSKKQRKSNNKTRYRKSKRHLIKGAGKYICKDNNIYTKGNSEKGIEDKLYLKNGQPISELQTPFTLYKCHGNDIYKNGQPDWIRYHPDDPTYFTENISAYAKLKAKDIGNKFKSFYKGKQPIENTNPDQQPPIMQSTIPDQQTPIMQNINTDQSLQPMQNIKTI